jgi:sec-independent protein translocase protein TatA
MIGTLEIVVIVLAVIILFGGKNLPDFARNLGKLVRGFKREFNEFQKSLNDDSNDKSEHSG